MKEAEKYSQYSFLLDRTARRVKQYARKEFKARGFSITVDQWLILKNLHDYEALSQKQLAERTFKDYPTMTRILDLLAEKQLVERKTDPEDRRSFTVDLTEEGEALVKALIPQVQTIRMKAWDSLSKDDFDNFKRILDTIYHNLDG